MRCVGRVCCVCCVGAHPCHGFKVTGYDEVKATAAKAKILVLPTYQSKDGDVIATPALFAVASDGRGPAFCSPLTLVLTLTIVPCGCVVLTATCSSFPCAD